MTRNTVQKIILPFTKTTQSGDMHTHDDRFPNVRINPGADISDNVQIGEGSLIGNNVVIRPNVKIGKNTVIAHNTIIESHCEIGDNTTIQVLNVIPSHTTIGNNVFIGPYFAIANCRHIPSGEKGTSPNKHPALLEHTLIEDEVVIGTGCSVVPGVRIGKGARINMRCHITSNIPAGNHIR